MAERNAKATPGEPIIRKIAAPALKPITAPLRRLERLGFGDTAVAKRLRTKIAEIKARVGGSGTNDG